MKVRWTMIWLLSAPVHANATDIAQAEVLIAKHGKAAVVAAILEKCGGEITIEAGGASRRVFGRQNPEFVTPSTVTADLDRCKVSEAFVESHAEKEKNREASLARKVDRIRRTPPRAASQKQPSMVDRYEKTLEAERDLRAAKLGITRETLDRMEGRAIQGSDSVEIVRWAKRPSPTGRYWYVEGTVRNRGDETKEYVKVVVKALDGSGELVAIESIYIEPSSLLPRGEGIFKASFDRSAQIEKFNLSVQE